MRSYAYILTIVALLTLLSSHSLAKEQESRPWTDSEIQALAILPAAQFAEKIAEWQSLAEQGDSNTMTRLGVVYVQGVGLNLQCEQGVKWLTKAAKINNAYAQHNLAILFYKGSCVAKDEARSLELFEQAARAGVPEAQNNLAVLYAEGIWADSAKALYWAKAGATQDFIPAQHTLAIILLGNNEVQDGLHLLTQVAEQGYGESQFLLAYFYHTGEHVSKDEALAFAFAEKAANQGIAEAQFLLANMYHFGEGTVPNKALATKWYKKSAKQGFAPASEMLKELSE